MAELIRNTHDLATIRIELARHSSSSNSDASVSIASFLGNEQCGSADLLFADIGLQSDLTVRNYVSTNFQLDREHVADLVEPLLSTADSDEPIWLQLGASAGLLAVVPWERFLQPIVGRPILRVPNFLADPVFAQNTVRIALVVSAPRAKSSFSVYEHAEAIVNAAQQALPNRTEIHIYADLDAYESLKHLGDAIGNLIVHSPTSGLDNEHASQLNSPWLNWIANANQGTAIDLVHFVCPGYFRGSQGALALAQSPESNEDRNWSHFVAADELIQFLDLVGAWSVGLSAPQDNVWAIGLRLLADRLAWQRPGPLFVHNAESGTNADIVATYQFLFASNDEVPPSSANMMLYSHPRRMQRYRSNDYESFESFEPLSRNTQFRVSSTSNIPDKLARITHKPDRNIVADGTTNHAAWMQANQLKLDRRLLHVNATESPAQQGALDALEFLDTVTKNALQPVGSADE